jgi:hypothetical protein
MRMRPPRITERTHERKPGRLPSAHYGPLAIAIISCIARRSAVYRAAAVSSASAAQYRRRALRAVGSVLVAYLALIASHEGEFWPCSVFPMFASAGKPWVRALVHELSAPLAEQDLRAEYELAELPGVPLALAANGVSQHDVSSLVQRRGRWSEADKAALARLFGRLPCRKPLLVLRVRGELEGAGVHALATPAALLSCSNEHVVLHPLPSGGAT